MAQQFLGCKRMTVPRDCVARCCFSPHWGFPQIPFGVGLSSHDRKRETLFEFIRTGSEVLRQQRPSVQLSVGTSCTLHGGCAWCVSAAKGRKPKAALTS
jgi:hypothetical protein